MNSETMVSNIEATSDQDSGLNTNREEQTTTKTTDGKSKWIRLIYMILFLIIFGFAEAVLYITTIICFVSHLVKQKPLPRAVEFGKTLSTYVADIVAFLTYSKENPPWPFDAIDAKSEE